MLGKEKVMNHKEILKQLCNDILGEHKDLNNEEIKTKLSLTPERSFNKIALTAKIIKEEMLDK